VAFVRTVLEDIKSSLMGVTDAHEYLIRTGGEEYYTSSIDEKEIDF
jgi:hypothetical protein